MHIFPPGTTVFSGKDLPDLDDYGDRVRLDADIPFGPEPHQQLDVYRPAGDAASASGPQPPRPGVACFFGGAFVTGTRKGMRRVCALAASRGLVAAAPSYRIADPDRDLPGWPGNMQDVRAAWAFLRSRAGDFGLDPSRLAALGHSSGGFLVMLAAFTEPDPARRPAAIINIAGVSDRRGHTGPGSRALLGRALENDEATLAAVSPVTHVRPGLPPVYTLHGESDRVVSPDQSRRLSEALTSAGVPNVLRLEPGMGHDPVTVRTMGEAFGWLEEVLK
jgi:acetyl esterase/lipase